MPFLIPEGTPPEMYPVAFLLGSWRAVGELKYPGIEARPVEVSVRWAVGSGPYFKYECSVADLDDESSPWSEESGYWRISPERPDGLAEQLHPIEAMIADPAGRVSVYVGAGGAGRVTVASDVIARTASAAAVTASQRMFGLVEDQLMWVWELAAFDQPLQPYLSVALDRVQE
ncbi:hypothetical protein GCM10010401_06450 [Rarobacter faecitabidus]|uniref:Uncharacterized protein DUF1794 n=1 Tax=Rarobacter faecitabidus TaxID=13243 RepID=A0A542ZTC0_RARFA|nr:FABP family protein [Rarobacter faecitabidus]TQL63605.1 uncharacterized protein DUF1794 [Rarobacter faecitabidus]